MRYKNLYFIIGAVLVLGALVFIAVTINKQNQVIAELRDELNQISAANTGSNSQALLEFQKKQAREAVISSERAISGEIKKKENNTLSIATQVADFQAVAATDFQKPAAVPLVAKTYRVIVDKNTKFGSGVTLAGLKEGDFVRVTADQAIYGVDSFTAIKIEKNQANLPKE